MFEAKDSKDDNRRKDGSTTIIGQGTRLKGEMAAAGGMRLDGDFEGTLTVSETLTMGETGTINGEATVKSANIGGKVRGNLTATESVVLEAKSELNGDLRTKRLVIHEGAVLNGQCLMSDAAGKSA
jgi:cytoskeletal protein CcmA (bactofilin family)